MISTALPGTGKNQETNRNTQPHEQQLMVISQFFHFLLMSLVVDLALHIAYPKLSAHAMPPPSLRGTSRRSPLPISSSRLRREPWFSWCLYFGPCSCRSPSPIALRCIILRQSCRVTLKCSHNNNTRSPQTTAPAREDTACVALGFVPVPVFALSTLRRSEVSSWYRLCTRAREMCLRA